MKQVVFLGDLEFKLDLKEVGLELGVDNHALTKVIQL